MPDRTVPEGKLENSGIDYDWYYGERRYLEDQKRLGQRRANQMVAGGAAGALVLSITFIEGIAASPTPWLLYLLAFAWAVLLLALGSSIGASLSQVKAFRATIADLDEMHRTGEYRNEWGQPGQDKITRRLNRLALASLCIGVVLLAVFAWINLWRKVAA